MHQGQLLPTFDVVTYIINRLDSFQLYIIIYLHHKHKKLIPKYKFYFRYTMKSSQK